MKGAAAAAVKKNKFSCSSSNPKLGFHKYSNHVDLEKVKPQFRVKLEVKAKILSEVFNFFFYGSGLFKS